MQTTPEGATIKIKGGESMLLDYQIEGLNKLASYNKCAFFWEMGTGKTFVGAEKLARLEATSNIVVCQKSKVNEWIEHFELYYPYFLVYDLTKKKSFDNFLKLEHCFKIGVINYDLLFRRPALQHVPDITLMLDESSLIQNEQTQRTKFILKMDYKNIILLSGTPINGKYENLYSQMQLLGYKVDKRLFYNMYIQAEFTDYGGKKVVSSIKYKNIDHLKQRLRKIGCDFLKTEDVMHLPEQRMIPVFVPSIQEYKKFKKDKIVTVDGVELVGGTILEEMLYLRQLAGMYNQNKYQAFVDLLNSTSDGFVVFYNFNEELYKLMKLVENRPISIISGQTKDLSAFERSDDAIVFVQYQAGAMGLNLQKYNKVIYFSPPLSSELYEQSKKRIHRIGTTRTCLYYKLISSGTIENRIYDTLKTRSDYTRNLFETEKTQKLV